MYLHARMLAHAHTRPRTATHAHARSHARTLTHARSRTLTHTDRGIETSTRAYALKLAHACNTGSHPLAMREKHICLQICANTQTRKGLHICKPKGRYECAKAYVLFRTYLRSLSVLTQCETRYAFARKEHMPFTQYLPWHLFFFAHAQDAKIKRSICSYISASACTSTLACARAKPREHAFIRARTHACAQKHVHTRRRLHPRPRELVSTKQKHQLAFRHTVHRGTVEWCPPQNGAQPAGSLLGILTRFPSSSNRLGDALQHDWRATEQAHLPC